MYLTCRVAETMTSGTIHLSSITTNTIQYITHNNQHIIMTSITIIMIIIIIIHIHIMMMIIIHIRYNQLATLPRPRPQTAARHARV